MAPSVSPSEFFATHLYSNPKSAISTDKIVSFISTLYAFSKVSGMNLSPENEIVQNIIINLFGLFCTLFMHD